MLTVGLRSWRDAWALRKTLPRRTGAARRLFAATGLEVAVRIGDGRPRRVLPRAGFWTRLLVPGLRG